MSTPALVVPVLPSATNPCVTVKIERPAASPVGCVKELVGSTVDVGTTVELVAELVLFAICFSSEMVVAAAVVVGEAAGASVVEPSTASTPLAMVDAPPPPPPPPEPAPPPPPCREVR